MQYILDAFLLDSVADHDMDPEGICSSPGMIKARLL